MKKLKFLVPILAFAFFSCDNYLDINDSPNTLTFDKATPSKLLPGAQVSTYRVQVGSMNQLGNVFMNSWTRNVQSYGNGFDKELQLNLDNGFYTTIWDGLYRNLMNFQAIINYPNPNGKYDLYVAAAKICKAHYMECIVDLYGDAPYSQAWKGEENLSPAYDDDYAIYQALIGDLESARNLINNASATAEDIAPYDVMLAGDMTRWTEFANTIQLRMCLRMSEVTGAKATYRDTKLADIASGPFLSDNVAINPGFSDATNDQGSPAFATYCYDVAGNLLQNRTFITMTGHAYKSLQSYATTNWAAFGNNYEIVPGSGINYPNVTDPRSARLYTAGSGQSQRRGVTQGSTNVDVGPAAFTVGLPCRLGLAGQFNPYGQSDGTLASYFACDGFVMTYAESCFLQAEAAVRYPSLFSNEQYWFDEGITDDFAMRNATVGSYITTINTKPNFGLAASTTTSQKLHAIMYQKWVALIGVNAIQSYIDYVRTGYPVTPLSTTAIQARKPYRLIYPVSEYVANSANVPNVSANDCFSLNSHTPFWVAGAPN